MTFTRTKEICGILNVWFRGKDSFLKGGRAKLLQSHGTDTAIACTVQGTQCLLIIRFHGDTMQIGFRKYKTLLGAMREIECVFIRQRRCFRKEEKAWTAS